jgi:hypothetical protein
MNHRHIIAQAWEFTQNNKKMIYWYAFFPSLLTTMAGVIYLMYQYFAFRSSPLFENWNQSFTMVALKTVVDIVRQNISSTFPLLVVAVIIIILYLLIPSACDGAIIQLIARKKNGQDVRTRDGLRFGMMSFLPLFEYSWLIRTFSLVSLFGNASFVMRNLGMTAFWVASPVFVVIAIAGIAMTVLFTYAEYYIVIDDSKVLESVAKSAKLVFEHLEETILLSILMLIISVRILIQLLFVLLIPLAIIGSIYLFASWIPWIGFVVGGVLGLGLLYLASYLSATIHVFAATVWTFSFLYLTNEPVVSAREKVEGKD